MDLRVDKLILQLVFYNILRNAIEASGEYDTIDVFIEEYSRRGRTYFKVIVRDFGKGMSNYDILIYQKPRKGMDAFHRSSLLQ